MFSQTISEANIERLPDVITALYDGDPPRLLGDGEPLCLA